MNRNQQYQELNPDVLAFLQELKHLLEMERDPAIMFPKGVNSVLEEQNSQWAFTLNFVNTTNSARTIALFKGGVNTTRIETVDALNEVPGINGGKLKTTYAQNKIIQLNDDPRVLNIISGIPVDVVASQEHKNAIGSSITQDIYADITGKITVTSDRFTLDFMRVFAELNALRMFAMKITSDSPQSMFSGYVKLKDLNPFENQLAIEIPLSKYVLSSSGIETTIEVPYKTYIGANTFMCVTIPANCIAGITLQVSAIHSQLNALRNLLKNESLLSSMAKASESTKRNNMKFLQSTSESQNTKS